MLMQISWQRYRQRGRLRSTAQLDHFPGQQCCLYINGVPVTSQYDECIRFHVNGYHLRQYVQQQNGWNDRTWNDVDFHIFGKFHKRLRQALREYHLKLVHDLLPLGSRRYREAPTKDDQLKLCPCCRLAEETPTHFLQCQKNPTFETSLATMRSDILTADIHPVRYLMTDGIRHWSTSALPFRPSVNQYPPHFIPLLDTALKSQAAIGRENACKGVLSGSWSHIAQLGMLNSTLDSRSRHRSSQMYSTSFL